MPQTRMMKESRSVKNAFKATTALLLVLFLSYCKAESCSAEGNVRLTGFNSTLVGYVEICKNDTWLKLVTGSNSWTHKDSIVVCQQLGYLGALWLFDKASKVLPVRSSSTDKTYTASVECTGTEQTLSSCMRNPVPSFKGQQVNFAACNEAPSIGDVRLVGVSYSDSEGLVEMFHPHRAYRWSTICTNGWDDTEANIVCKQLGYGTGKSKIYGSLDVTANNPLPRKRYDNFKCNGTETFLSQCLNDGPYPYKCYSGDYAGVICQNHDDPVRVDVPPTAAFLVLVTGALLLLLVVAALVVNCAIRKLKKKAPAITEQQLDVTSRTNRRGINRVRLNSQGWQHTSEEGYTPLSSAAPPSYTDTIRADQEAQHHHSLQAVSLSSMSCSPQTTEEINEHLSRDSSTNIDS